MEPQIAADKLAKRGALTSFRINLRTYMMVIALVGIWLIFTVLTRAIFITPRNITNLFRQSVFTALLAIGMVNVIILGQIDLSVGSVAGLCGGVLAICNVWKGLTPGLSILITLLVGITVGAWNGWWVAYRKVPAFIVTMAGLLVFRGVLIGLTDGITVGPLDPFFKTIGKDFLSFRFGFLIGAVSIVLLLVSQYRERRAKIKHRFIVPSRKSEMLRSFVSIFLVGLFIVIMNLYHGIPNPVIGLLFFFIVFQYITKRTVFGRRTYAIGGNRIASRLVGINIERHTLIVYILSGLMVAIAGIFLTSRLDSASVDAGTSAELDAIAACVIGGTSLMGGIGTVFGAVIGAIVMSSLDNGMSLMDAPFFWQIIVKGLVLLIAVWVDMTSKSKG